MGVSTTRGTSAASEAWALMFELMHHSKQRFMAIASEFDLSPPQVMALRQLDPDEPKPMSELAAALRCDNSNVTGIVDRLEERGLVKRRAAEHDRRVKLIELTEEGQRVRREIERRITEPPQAIADLPEADQIALRDILRRALEPGE